MKHIDLSAYDIIAAADSGYDLACSLGLQVQLLVGDLDSIVASDIPEDVQIVRYPQGKDDSDTVLGMKALIQRGVTRLLILGGGEGRMDHLLSLCMEFIKSDADIHWITGLEHVWIVRDTIELTGSEGTRVSIFPEPGVKVSSEGLIWGTDNVLYSLSNQLSGKRCRITVHGGAALVMMDSSGYLGQ